nr:hypothetical protein [Pedobacter sp. ASV19]
MKTNCKICAIVFLLACTILSCKKTDKFYNKLQNLPQIDQSAANAYKSAYIVGDVMIITGSLQPKNNLQISIGGITADIVKTDSIKNPQQSLAGRRPFIDRVYVSITAAMVGKNQQVKVTSDGYSTIGPAIDVYTPGGRGSFSTSLFAAKLTDFSSENVLLYCQNGKGDVYYYVPDTQTIVHIKKDGTQQAVYNLSSLVPSLFLCGGVDPVGNKLFFSIQAAGIYGFYQLDLHSKAIVLLNQSVSLSAPYEGRIGSVHMVVTGVYPDSAGNLYLGLGQGNKQNMPFFLPDAIAKYSLADGKITYLYKSIVFGNSFTNMPGISLNAGNTPTGLRFSPDENLLYLLQTSYIDAVTGVIAIYDLSASLKIQEFTTSNTTDDASQYQAIAPLNGLHINMGEGSNPAWSFGFLPMTGRRLQMLLYQNYKQAVNYGFSKWIVLDFIDKRTYAYAPDNFSQNGYSFFTKDLLLNYDEEGNLYATGNNLSAIIKTQAN